MKSEVILATLLVPGDYIFIDRRKYRVIKSQKGENVKLLLERNGLNSISIHDRYDTFRTIPSPELRENI